MHGLYAAKDGPEQALVSQCQATDARGIFPCWDEPAFKATLQWTVRTKPDLTVITNGVLKSRRRTNQGVVHRFETTRVIPTYLAAITIGKYDITPAVDVTGTPCRILCGRGKLGQTDFSQAVTSQVVPWYETYFGHPYNYQKLDQVAVPGFDAGAMENVGAIFYRQTLLLMDPEVTSWKAQKRIAEVVAHEIAHQWFGNLVTMHWWDDLWLNEAFATWIAYKACDAWQPEWRMWDDYQEGKEQALNADSLVNTHPIYTPISSPAEATELFDLITYEKGCAVLRMTESYLGEKQFRAGIRAYMRRFKNKNARGHDLWNMLAKTSKQPVGELMGNWINQPGFPLVDVDLKQQSGKSVLKLKQRRFFADPRTFGARTKQTWDIPMVIRYGTAKGIHTHRVLFSESTMEVVLPGNEPVLWAYPNADASGFFRMHFSKRARRQLIHHGLDTLTPTERVSLIYDEWALVRCGRGSSATFLELLVALSGDEDHTVTCAVVDRLSHLNQDLVGSKHKRLFRKLIQTIMAPHYESLGGFGPKRDTPQRSVKRAAILHAMGNLARNRAVQKEAGEITAKLARGRAVVDPNLAQTVVDLAAMRGGTEELASFLKTYLRRKKQGAPPEQQNQFLAALTAFEDSAAIRKLLEHITDGTVPQEQIRTVLVSLLKSKKGQRPVWRYIKANWATLAPKVGAMGIARLVEATGALPIALRTDVERFFDKHGVLEAKRAAQKALEAMDLRTELCEREGPVVGQWLETWSTKH